MSDTGLLCAASMDNIQLDLLQGRLNVNMGSILENVIAQELQSKNYSLHYFDAKKYGEIDFVLQNGSYVDLLEVKSGNDFKKHKALDNILNFNDWNFRNTVVLCKNNIQQTEKISYLPWYMIMFIKPTQVPENLIRKIDISGL